jgi:hypothetical protein
MKNFNDGFLRYETGMKQAESPDSFVDISQWEDGYIAFSELEKRIHDLGDMEFSLTDRIHGLGFVTEIDVWRHGNGVWEELVLEREDHGYFMQHWTLFDQAENRPEKTRACYWRQAETTARKPLGNPGIFCASPKKDSPLHALEIICPDQRLHFFLTTGESKDLSARRLRHEK